MQTTVELSADACGKSGLAEMVIVVLKRIKDAVADIEQVRFSEDIASLATALSNYVVLGKEAQVEELLRKLGHLEDGHRIKLRNQNGPQEEMMARAQLLGALQVMRFSLEESSRIIRKLHEEERRDEENADPTLHGLGRGICELLNDSTGKLTNEMIAKSLRRHPSVISRTLNVLARNGYVARRQDSRSMLNGLTEKGMAALGKRRSDIRVAAHSLG